MLPWFHKPDYCQMFACALQLHANQNLSPKVAENWKLAIQSEHNSIHKTKIRIRQKRCSNACFDHKVNYSFSVFKKGGEIIIYRYSLFLVACQLSRKIIGIVFFDSTHSANPFY